MPVLHASVRLPANKVTECITIIISKANKYHRLIHNQGITRTAIQVPYLNNKYS